MILFSPLRLVITYKDRKLDIEASFGVFKIKFPTIKNNKKKAKTAKESRNKKTSDDFFCFEKFFAVIQAFYESSPRIKKCITVEKLEINSKFGSEDAAFTGMVTGFAYAEIYKLIAFLATIFTLEKPIVIITPVFEDKSVFHIDFKGIIKTKATHIIFTAIKFYTEYKNALKRKD